VIKKI